MNTKPAPAPTLTFKEGLLWSAVALASFHLAYSFASCAFLIAVCLFALLQLSRVRTSRIAFYTGLGVGLSIYGPKLLFFWTVFGPSAIALWLVLAFWLGVFLVLVRFCRERFGERWVMLAAPVVWTGLEYFRSELYYLRFTWLNAGYAFAWSPALPAVKWLGMYGVGCVLMALAAGVFQLRSKPRLLVGLFMLNLLRVATKFDLPFEPHSPTIARTIHVAGVQLEFPGELEVLDALQKLHRAHPEAELLVLSEYTFTEGPVPERVRNWCRTNRLHLVVGRKDELPGGAFRNTVIVIGPGGDIVFKQAKMQPIQFFKDGLPALEQRVWESPWGKLGIGICYDLSYTRIVDGLVRLGAQAILAPTMDVADWGEAQHLLHARVAPLRAAEHGLPIFRLASSGISQFVDARGVVRASAPFPGEGSMLAAELRLVDKGTRPLDRMLAPVCTALTALLAAGMALLAAKKKFSRS